MRLIPLHESSSWRRFKRLACGAAVFTAAQMVASLGLLSAFQKLALQKRTAPCPCPYKLEPRGR